MKLIRDETFVRTAFARERVCFVELVEPRPVQRIQFTHHDYAVFANSAHAPQEMKLHQLHVRYKLGY